MKLNAELDHEKHDVEFSRDGREVTAKIDGREYVLDVSEPEAGTYLIKVDGRIYSVNTLPPSSPAEPWQVQVGRDEFEIKVVDPKRLRGTSESDVHAEGIVEIRTAMPGKVVRIMVAAGDEVVKGSGVIVVEAMKMQNELRSPKDGVVKEIRVSEGLTVNSGDVLLLIE